MDYHVWGAMLEAYHKLRPKSKSITEREVLLVVWDSLPQEPINKAVHTVTELKRCTKADGEQFERKKWLSNIRQSAHCVLSVTLFCCFGANVFFQRAKIARWSH